MILLADYFGAFSHVCFLKNDSYNESRYFIPLFQSAGHPVDILEYDDIPKRPDLLDGAEDLTLQPYIPQIRIRGKIGEELRYDYIVGTLLFFENQFFGPGVFRSSSSPITNQGDTRRLAHIVTDDIQYFDPEMVV